MIRLYLSTVPLHGRRLSVTVQDPSSLPIGHGMVVTASQGNVHVVEAIAFHLEVQLLQVLRRKLDVKGS